MKKKLNKLSALFVVFIALFSACEKSEKIDKFPIEPSKLVLNGTVINGEFLSVNVSKSLPSIDNADNNFIDDAEVFFYEDNEPLSTVLFTGSGNYTVNHKAGLGKTYRVEVFLPRYKAVVASTAIPEAVDLDIISHRIIDSGSFGDSYRSLYINQANIDIRVESLSGGAYLKLLPKINVYSDGIVVKTESIFISNISDGNLVNGSIYLNPNETSSNEVYDISMDYRAYLRFFLSGSGNVAFDSITLAFSAYGYSEDLYKYDLTRSHFFESQGNPFADPVQIYTNVEGGFGIFGGQYETVIEKKIELE